MNLFWTKNKIWRKKYSAEWALITGASSGIGRAVAFKLASQGLNVVLVALPDDLLDDTFKSLTEKFSFFFFFFQKEVFKKTNLFYFYRFPNQKFRKIGADLGKYDEYMKDIVEQTKDIDIQILFNNAGYVVTCCFTDMSEGAVFSNYNCNSTVSVRLTHHFLRKMLEKKQKGCVVFTSSPAGDIPNPTAALYGSTKNFLTEFGASLAPEVKEFGIDVLVMRPSPVASRFFW